jgi:hypothetical protein
LEGISYYIKKRLTSSCRNQDVSPFDDIYLKDWEFVANAINTPDDKPILLSIMETQPEGNDIVSWKLGLENGCAGYGLKCI